MSMKMLTNKQFRMNLNIKDSEKTINQRIAKIAEELKYYPAAFAKQINVQRQKVSNVLEGKFEPKADILISISIAFPKLNTRWLLTGEGEMWIERELQVSEPAKPYVKSTGPEGGSDIKNQLLTFNSTKSMDHELLTRLVSVIEKQQEDISALIHKIPTLGERKNLGKITG